MKSSEAANRDMLIGLLALQNGLVDQSVLVSAFRAWSRDRSRPLADILVDQGAIDAGERSLLLGLAENHLKRHGGDAERSLAAIDAGPSTRKSLGMIGDPEIEATIGHLGKATDGTDQDAAGRTSTYHVHSMPGDGQRFRTLRPHARGGLGAVFVALDSELNREVALKQILDHHADDPTSRARFVHEAEITGGLEHPGIVPVYGLGSYGDGRPYYAMRFVRGQSLKEAIAAFHEDASLKKTRSARSLALRNLLHRFVDVCNAIEYAHTRGVLHRDIKPANVILGKYGETLVVDWGLAKALGKHEPDSRSEERTLMPSSASGSADTLPGSAMGTPAYMSPEQAFGDLERIGPRSDVYSLGATLFCLLTGRPAFEGEDVGAILQAVQKGNFPAPRQLDPSIERPLEAICLKAMALKPEDRYPAVRSLAEDVEHWAADSPVKAFREPLRLRLARWERSHKNLVYGMITTLAITAFGLAVTASVVAEQRRISERAKDLADEKTGEADAHFRMAVNAANDLLNQISDQQLSQSPGMTATRIALSEGAINYFGRFVEARPNDPEILAKAARVFSNAAYSRGSLGKIYEAYSAFKRAIEFLERREKILGEAITEADRLLLCEELSKIAYYELDRGLAEIPSFGFEKYLERARLLADRLVGSVKGTSMVDLKCLELGGRVDLLEAIHAYELGDLEKAKASYTRAADRLARSYHSGAWFWVRLYEAQAHRGLGRIAHASGDNKTADLKYAESLKIIREVVKANPNHTDPKYVLSWTQAMNGERLATIPARKGEADEPLAEAFDLIDKVSRDFPDETRYAALRGRVLLDRAARLTEEGHDDRAEPLLEEAHKKIEGLALVSDRENRNTWCLMGRAEIALGKLRLRQKRTAEAVKLLESAVNRLKALRNDCPKNVEFHEVEEQAKAARQSVASAGNAN